MLIPAGRRPGSPDPLVTIRSPLKTGPRPIVFNRALVGLYLEGASYVVIDLDMPSKTMSFAPSKEEYQGIKSHRLGPDGGRNGQSARLIFIRSNALDDVPSGRYTPTISGIWIKICWAKTKPADRARGQKK